MDFTALQQELWNDLGISSTWQKITLSLTHRSMNIQKKAPVNLGREMHKNLPVSLGIGRIGLPHTF